MSREQRRRRRHAQPEYGSEAQEVTLRSPYITRNVPVFELLDDAGLTLIETNADRILEEIGIEFRNDPAALQLLQQAGAVIDGERVRFPQGMCREIIQRSAPASFIQHARNPANNIEIGGKNTVFAPAYGSPFIRNLEEGRRYATIEDFRNFVKLAYSTPHLHHSGGTICEPVDLPVNKRHFDMIYSHLRYSDKPFMGSVTAPERAEDSVAMAKIVFGDEFVENHAVILSLINASSPMAFDATMLGAARVYALHNQATIITPFIVAGAMAPVTVAAVAAQSLAEGLAGMTFIQLTRPGAPMLYGNFVMSMSMQTGAPTFGSPEAAQALNIGASLARRLGVPFRSGGSLCASKVADAQAAYESSSTLQATVTAGVNFVLHTAGWLEGGLVMGYEKFILDCDQAGMARVMLEGIDLSENGQAMDAIHEVGPGAHFLGCAHTRKNFRHAFYRSQTADNNSWEQWVEDGELDAPQRAEKIWHKMLEDYQEPALDVAILEQLDHFVATRKASFEDANY